MKPDPPAAQTTADPGTLPGVFLHHEPGGQGAGALSFALVGRSCSS